MSYKVGLFLPDLAGGGAQRVALNLARGLLNTGCQVSIILVNNKGPLLCNIHPDVNVVSLNASRTFTSIPKLALHFRRTHYDCIISFMNYVNICAVLADQLACSCHHVALTEHTIVSRSFENITLLQRIVRRTLMYILYPLADHVICVSDGAASDLKRLLNLSSVNTIPNPIDVNNITSSRDTAPPHSWFEEPEPIVLGAGRLTKVKGFSTLIHSVRHIRDLGLQTRLIIIGEGEHRNELEVRSRELGLDDVVSLPGFVDNPYQFMRAADVFVLSSQWEGFGNVLVEAMACGTQVVATNCPGGPVEILEHGNWGQLVPVGDDMALARATMSTLVDPMVSPDDLRERAKDFSPEKIAKKYVSVIKNGASR